ncbi:AdaA [Paenibacillus mucilaginosus 3016]|uniref:AdaA n=1 Tax=Paenibacillus mucilaginosus 3016 TaxID=1116391 RepID=H6NG02_9BACL|nr:AdaA [Paenibacillus mucilaginosus 3016]
MEPELFDRIYETIANKEDTYDGVYYTGVLTTRIVCRPSCRARTPKKENIRLYPSVEAAIQAGFRPCKRCKPEAPGPHGPDRALAAQVDALIATRLWRPADAENAGRAAGGVAVSPAADLQAGDRAQPGGSAPAGEAAGGPGAAGGSLRLYGGGRGSDRFSEPLAFCGVVPAGDGAQPHGVPGAA